MKHIKTITLGNLNFEVEYNVTEPDRFTEYQGGEIEIEEITYKGEDFYPLFDELGQLNIIIELLK